MPRKKKKRKLSQYLDNCVRKQRRVLYNLDKRTKSLKEELQVVQKKLKMCQGTDNILQYKVLRARKEAIEKELNKLQSDDHKHKMHGFMAEMEQLHSSKNKKKSIIRREKRVIPMNNRLLPPKPNTKNMLQVGSERANDKWKTLRAYKKRYEVLSQHKSKHTTTRTNYIDKCSKCNAPTIVDKETSIRVCQKSGCTLEYRPYIFETKEVENNDHKSTRQQSLIHMQKHGAQYERGYPSANVDVLEKLSVAYQKIHSHDPYKVQTCKTFTMMKSKAFKDKIPPIYKKAPDRITKELTRASIPEFTDTELSQLLNQRNRLQIPDAFQPEEKKVKKSFNNQIYMRNFGRANGQEQSRLFHQQKTNKIHRERTNTLELESLNQYHLLGNQPGQQWYMYPST